MLNREFQDILHKIIHLQKGFLLEPIQWEQKAWLFTHSQRDIMESGMMMKRRPCFESLKLEIKVDQALGSRPIIFEVEHII